MTPLKFIFLSLATPKLPLEKLSAAKFSPAKTILSLQIEARKENQQLDQEKVTKKHQF